MAKSIKTDMSPEQLARAYMVARRELERLRHSLDEAETRFEPNADHDYGSGWLDALHYVRHGQLPDEGTAR